MPSLLSTIFSEKFYSLIIALFIKIFTEHYFPNGFIVIELKAKYAFVPKSDIFITFFIDMV